MKKTKSHLSQKGFSAAVLLIVVAVFAGGAFYLYLKTRTELKQTQIPHQDVLEEPAQRGGGTIRDMDIPIYPGSRKTDEVGVDPGVKASIYMVKAEFEDVSGFYVDELKKLGVNISREKVKQQLVFTSDFVLLEVDKTSFIQIGTQKDENGEIGYQIVAPVSD